MSALRRLSPPSPPPRSPERQRLGAAIQRLAEAVAQAEKIEEARQKIGDRLFDELEPAVRKAQQAVDEARDDAPGLLVEAVLNGGIAEDATAVARINLRQAEAAVEQARQARRLLSEEAGRAQNAIATAKQALDRAKQAVVGSDQAKQAVVAEFFRAGRRLLKLARVLMTLRINVSRGVEAVDLGLTLRIGDIARPGSGGNASLFTPDPEWAAAIAALSNDADAVLPGLPPAEDGPTGDAGAEAA